MKAVLQNSDNISKLRSGYCDEFPQIQKQKHPQIKAEVLPAVKAWAPAPMHKNNVIFSATEARLLDELLGAIAAAAGQ
jgi:hypothetical protein